MEQLIRADDIKPDFEGLKLKWGELLEKYFLSTNLLNPRFTIDVPCPFCRSTKFEQTFCLNGFFHRTCEECKTLYVSPRLSDACVEELYSDAYYNEMYARSMLPVFEKRKALIGHRKYQQTVTHWAAQEPGRVLDIGAGIGEVIDVFRDKGWTTHAIEMNPVAVDWLNTRNHAEVFHGPIDAWSTSHQFDIVMAWGVLEHVVDPAAFLNRVHNLLVPGGLFVSEVPHGQCLLVDLTRKTGMDPKRILMGEQHIVLYSTRAYVQLHERHGFHKVHVQTNGLDVDTIFKESNVSASPQIIATMQECIDDRLYGDLLRGFWRR